MKSPTVNSALAFLCVVLVGVLGGIPLYNQRCLKPLPLAPAAGVKQHRLSKWAPWLAGTRGDTEVLILAAPDATAANSAALLLLGGTHPDEPAALVSALIVMNAAHIGAGRLFIIPRANASAFTNTEPGEGHPPSYKLPLPNGTLLTIPFGGRLTHPLDQWPSPDVKPHVPSGQLLSSKDLRNLNRCFPGDSTGLFTERVAAGITALVRKEVIDIVVDLHEASLEYPVINAMVAHERALDMASAALIELDEEELRYTFEPSPEKLRGLSHRELGDYTVALPILVETANVAQGRLRGRTTTAMIVQGYDDAYRRAVATGLLKVAYPDSGIPLEVRCGRHLSALLAIIAAWNEQNPTRPLLVSGIPHCADLCRRGVGAFLIPAPH